MITQLEALLLNEEDRESLKTLALSLRAEWAVQRSEERTAAQLKLHQLNVRLDRLTDAFLDNALDRELFESRKRAPILERKDLQERCEDLVSDDFLVHIKLAEFLELAKTASLS